ncbi:hypothetical protein AZ66_23480 [Paenibacillus sp. E194]|nr:hypothetical protein AZ66_23480 [Paenibacillus sp. E194]
MDFFIMRMTTKRGMPEGDSSKSYYCLRIFEKDTFLQYIHIYKDDFLNRLAALDDKWSWTEANTQRLQEQILIRMKTGKVLNQMLNDFRQIGLQNDC